MSRELRVRRSARGAAMLISLSLGTGCLTMLAKSAADWAALAARYSEAANRGGMCTEGAPRAADAGAAAGRAKDAAEDADRALGRSDSLGAPGDPQVLARVRQLADAAVPTYNAALEPLRSASDDLGNDSEELGALFGLAALDPLGALFWSALATDLWSAAAKAASRTAPNAARASSTRRSMRESTTTWPAHARASMLPSDTSRPRKPSFSRCGARRTLRRAARASRSAATPPKSPSNRRPAFHSNDDDRAERRAYSGAALHGQSRFR